MGWCEERAGGPWARALAAVRCAAPVQDLAPVLPYLREAHRYTFDVPVQVSIRPNGRWPHTTAHFLISAYAVAVVYHL